MHPGGRLWKHPAGLVSQKQKQAWNWWLPRGAWLGWGRGGIRPQDFQCEIPLNSSPQHLPSISATFSSWTSLTQERRAYKLNTLFLPGKHVAFAGSLSKITTHKRHPSQDICQHYFPIIFLSNGFLSVGCEERGLHEITCEGFIHAYEPSSLVHWKTDYANNGQIILTLSPKMPRRPALYLQ